MRLPMNEQSELLYSETFNSLWCLVNERFVTWAEFKMLPMPEGYDNATIWKLLSTLRRGTGIRLTYPPWFNMVDGDNKHLWFSIPHSLSDNLREIVRLAAVDSSLAQSLKQFDSAYLQYYLIERELVVACRRDGVVLSLEEARQAWLAPPRQPSSEQLIFRRLVELFLSAEEIATAPLSISALEHLYESLAGGITKVFTPVYTLYSDNSTCEYFTSAHTFELTCEMMNGGGSDHYLHPVFSVIEISRHLWDYQPFEHFNACMEVLIRRVFCLKAGYPLIAYLSLVQIDESIQASQESEFGVYTTAFPAEYQVVGVDVTWYQNIMLARYIEDLERLRQHIDAFFARRRHVRTCIGALASLNHRQKDVLHLFCRNPGEQLTISSHRERHKVSYATARADLLSLSETAYLRVRPQQQAFIFISGPRLIELLGE
jgi:hypothetical protein